MPTCRAVPSAKKKFATKKSTTKKPTIRKFKTRKFTTSKKKSASREKSISKSKRMSKEDVVRGIQRCAKKLKRTPGFRDLEAAGVTRGVLTHRWGGLQQALAAAGIEAAGAGYRYADSTLLLDWARTARKLGRIPTVLEYRRASRFCHAPLHARYGWKLVPDAFEKYAREASVQREWKDVLAMAEARPRKGPRFQISTARHTQSLDLLPGRPIYGNPLPWPELVHEPVNEAGVVFAFGMLARRLGFAVRRIQRAFPDCEAVREIARNQWQQVRVEFEFESRNFLLHGHDPNGCDVIVCWVHNWPDCPLNIDVVELCKLAREGPQQGFSTQIGAENADKTLGRE